MRRTIMLLLLVCLLGACAPTEAELPAATIAPTKTPVPPSTFTPAPTEAPTETPEPTPTPDLRSLSAEPIELIMISDDLPEAGKYFVSQTRGTLSNEMLVAYINQQLGQEAGNLLETYLEETTRLNGYTQNWTRGAWAFEGPLYIANEIAVFNSIQGAQLEVTKYKPLLMNAMNGRIPSHQEIEIGDETRIYVDTVIENGQEADLILIEFSYRNVVIDIGCMGEKGKYTLEDVVAIAENVYLRLQELPLVDAIQ